MASQVSERPFPSAQPLIASIYGKRLPLPAPLQFLLLFELSPYTPSRTPIKLSISLSLSLSLSIFAVADEVLKAGAEFGWTVEQDGSTYLKTTLVQNFHCPKGGQIFLCSMAPHKKSKKSKRELKKLKKPKSISIVVSVEPKAIESDWWDTFWHKNSSTPGCSVPNDEAEAFKYYFRVSKKTFSYICSLVREDLISRPPSGLINIEGRLLSVEKQVAIALRRLASGESQVSVGAAFGVGQSTVSQVTWRFIEALEERAKHHLKWPDFNRMEEIKSKFEASFGLLNCCGAIDATHIIMTLPAVQTSDDWCDRENNYSMLLQGIVDHEMRFLDIVTGWPGGMTVSRLLKCTGFFKLCEAGERLNGNVRSLSGGEEIGEFIVGGVGYPLLPWLLTPYESNGLSTFMSTFNSMHEAARLLAMRAFSQVKGSWRILYKVMWRPDKQKLPSIILVCCLLHNIMIDCGDNLLQDVALSGHHDPKYGELCCKQVDPVGRTQRENLAKYLHLGKEKAPSK